MTKKILLALALILFSLTLAAPPASACGGYAVETPESIAVRAAVIDYYRQRRAHEEAPTVYGIVLTSARRAEARVHLRVGDGFETRVVRLSRRGERWTVRHVRPLA